MADAKKSRKPAGDYEVGYCKPPRHTRFEKGRSGNPKGRPSGSKNLATLLTEALNEPVTVTENGRRRRISKREAIVTQLVNKSASADLRAIHMLVGMIQQLEGRAEPITAQPESFEEADRLVLQQLRERLQAGRDGGAA